MQTLKNYAIGIATGIVIMTIDSWPTWAVLLIALCIALAAISTWIDTQYADEPQKTDNPIGDEVARELGIDPNRFQS